MKCNLNDQSKRIPIDRNRREIGESARKSRGGEEERKRGRWKNGEAEFVGGCWRRG